MNIVPRNQWGAKPPRRAGSRAPRRRARLYLHHTDKLPKDVGLGRAGVRWVQDYHQRNGWLDVGYPFLYSPTEREVYIGRSAETVGGHTQGSNATAHALAVLGDHHPPTGDKLPGYVVEDLAAFLRWYEREGYGVARFDGGHRDAPRASTACPGDHLHQLIPLVNGAVDGEEDDVLTPQDVDRIAEAVARKLGWVDPNRDGQFRSYQADASRLRDTTRAIAEQVGVDPDKIRA